MITSTKGGHSSRVKLPQWSAVYFTGLWVSCVLFGYPALVLHCWLALHDSQPQSADVTLFSCPHFAGCDGFDPTVCSPDNSIGQDYSSEDSVGFLGSLSITSATSFFLPLDYSWAAKCCPPFLETALQFELQFGLPRKLEKSKTNLVVSLPALAYFFSMKLIEDAK